MTRRAPRDLLGWLFLAPLAVVVLFVGAVLAALGLRLPPQELWAALGSGETLYAVRLSLATSLIALAGAGAVALPAAYALARREIPGTTLIDTLLDLPLVMPPLVAGMGLLFLFGRRVLGEPLAAIGVEVLFSPAGVVVAQGFVATTVLLRAARAAFDAVERRFGEVAATLRAGPWEVFVSVDLRLAAPGILAGMVLAWARAIAEFGATLMLAGATRFHTETLPMAVYLNIATGETDVAVACAMILLGVAFVLLLALRVLRVPVRG